MPSIGEHSSFRYCGGRGPRAPHTFKLVETVLCGFVVDESSAAFLGENAGRALGYAHGSLPSQ